MRSIRQNLSLHMNEIKGFAILWVMFFHASLELEGLVGAVHSVGYGGVDMLLFLSGFGLYHSLQQDADPGRYLKRRASRLLPAYLPFCLVWLAVMVPLHGAGLATSIRIIVGNLSMTGYLADVPLVINWYPGALLVTILLAPLFYACLKDGPRYLLRLFVLLAVLLISGLAFIGSSQYIIVSRLPVFVLGMAFARAGWQDSKEKQWALGLAAAFAAGVAVLYVSYTRLETLLIEYAMHWHPFVLIAPAMCAGLGWLFSKCPKRLRAPFVVLGRASFEVFLCNAWVEVLAKRYLHLERWESVAATAASVAAGLAYHVLVMRMTNAKKSQKGC